MSTDRIQKLDSRGRLTLATAVRKITGLDAAAYYAMSVAEDGTVTLTPATISAQR